MGGDTFIPDAVCFVNGILVADFESSGIESPITAAINQLLRYSNQRREIWPAFYDENKGVERLFHTKQLLIASNFFEAPASTIGAPPEAYLEMGRQVARTNVHGRRRISANRAPRRGRRGRKYSSHRGARGGRKRRHALVLP